MAWRIDFVVVESETVLSWGEIVRRTCGTGTDSLRTVIGHGSRPNPPRRRTVARLFNPIERVNKFKLKGGETIIAFVR